MTKGPQRRGRAHNSSYLLLVLTQYAKFGVFRQCQGPPLNTSVQVLCYNFDVHNGTGVYGNTITVDFKFQNLFLVDFFTVCAVPI